MLSGWIVMPCLCRFERCGVVPFGMFVSATTVIDGGIRSDKSKKGCIHINRTAAEHTVLENISVAFPSDDP